MNTKRNSWRTKIKAKRLALLIFVALSTGISAYFVGFGVANSIHENSIRFSLPLSTDWGTLVGGFSSLLAAGVSCYATVLLYRTYHSQQKELKATTSALRLQKIDSAFFNMLAMLESIIQGMSQRINIQNDTLARVDSDESKVFKGREYLQQAVAILRNLFKMNSTNFQVDMTTGAFKEINGSGQILNGGVNDLREYVCKTFDILMNDHNHKSNLAHYFRYVYNIIKFIDENQLGQFETKRYMDILQAQLSQDELCLIFYDSTSERGKKRNGVYQFAEWLEKYDILSNLDPDWIFKDYHYWLHPKTNFKFMRVDAKLIREYSDTNSNNVERRNYVSKFIEKKK